MFEEEQFHLRTYLRVIRKRQWMIFSIIFVCMVIAMLYIIRQTPVYKATAQILIEKEAPNIVAIKEVVDPVADDEYFTTQANILTSRLLAKEVLRKLGLPVSPAAGQASSTSLRETVRQYVSKILAVVKKWLGVPEPVPLSEEASAEAAEGRKLDEFLRAIQITPVRGSRLLNVNVVSTDRVLAARIANTLVEAYIEQQLEDKLSASKHAVSWLLKEVEDAKQKVTDAEEALQQYKEASETLSFSDREKIVMQKLSDLSNAANQAKIKRMAVESQYRQVQSFQRGELETVPQIINDPLLRDLKSKLLNLESRRSELLEKFRSKHPSLIALDSQIDAVQQQFDIEIQQMVTSLKNEYDLAKLQENELLEALEQQKIEAQELNQQSVQYNVLKREVESHQRIYETLLQRAKETSLTERLETSHIKIVEKAIVPSFPFAPNKKQSLMLALISGTVIALSLAFFLEYLDHSFRVPDDIKRYLDIPFLGVIPKVSTKDIVPDEEEEALETIVATITIVDAKSSIAEAYRSLRTNVSFASLDKQGVFLVTSSVPSEGKSSVTANLGIAMAQSGRKTLLIDCDFRKPMVHKIFHLTHSDYGLSDLLLFYEGGNGHRIESVIQETGVPHLDVIPCGSIPPNPSELLSQKKMGGILAALKEQYEVILIDSPPINVVTDPIILSRLVEGVILIVRAGLTTRDATHHAKEQIQEANAHILGGVLNSVDIQKDNYYYHYYYYGYKYNKYYYYSETEKS